MTEHNIGRRVLRNAVALGLTAIIYASANYINEEYHSSKIMGLTKQYIDAHPGYLHSISEEASHAKQAINYGSLGFALASLYVANRKPKTRK